MSLFDRVIGENSEFDAMLKKSKERQQNDDLVWKNKIIPARQHADKVFKLSKNLYSKKDMLPSFDKSAADKWNKDYYRLKRLKDMSDAKRSVISSQKGYQDSVEKNDQVGASKHLETGIKAKVALKVARDRK